MKEARVSQATVTFISAFDSIVQRLNLKEDAKDAKDAKDLKDSKLSDPFEVTTRLSRKHTSPNANSKMIWN